MVDGRCQQAIQDAAFAHWDLQAEVGERRRAGNDYGWAGGTEIRR